MINREPYGGTAKVGYKITIECKTLYWLEGDETIIKEAIEDCCVGTEVTNVLIVKEESND